MIPVNQFILGSSDPLLYPSEKMTNSIDEQIAPLTQEQQNMLLSNQDYVNNYNALQSKVFESAITFWFKDVDFDGDKVWEYFHMNN